MNNIPNLVSNEPNRNPQTSSEQALTSCTALSFLIGDGVCDEATNTYRCLYDGGDCCKADSEKDTKYCQDCTCKLTGKYYLMHVVYFTN